MLYEFTAEAHSRAVDEDIGIESARRKRGLQRHGGIGAREIKRERNGLDAELGRERRSGRRQGLRPARDEHQRAVPLGETPGNGEANTLRPACYNNGRTLPLPFGKSFSVRTPTSPQPDANQTLDHEGLSTATEASRQS